MRRLSDFNFQGKKVLVRCDFNVPLNEKGQIAKRTSSSSLSSLPSEPKILDDFRIRQSIPTIEYLIKNGAKVILVSHLGRPKGKFVKKFSLRPVAKRLGKLLKRKVHPVKSAKGGAAKPQFNRVKFLPDCIGKKVEKAIERMKSGEVVLLENLRFYKEEEENDQNFAKSLAQLADIFINDAFSVCHRSHASVVGITKYLPSGAGILLEKEIKALSQIMKNPKRPLVVIIGGKKVEDKAKVVENFSQTADFVLTGGLVAKEIKKGKIKIRSLSKVFFPLDSKDNFDIGQKTIKIFREKIQKAKTIFWAGPLGKIEDRKYQRGTKEIARAILKSQAFSVVGGGDTIEFINRIGLAEKFDHLSIGGGAMLEFLAGQKLPGLKALKYGDKES